jgi:hypothetical protein
MPAKSRRNRSNLSRNKPIGINSKTAVPNPIDQNSITQPTRVEAAYNSSLKKAPDSNLDLSGIGNELKWIGITTGIVIIILVILYFLWR